MMLYFVLKMLNNFDAASTPLSGDVVRAIHTLWERELKDNPLPW